MHTDNRIVPGLRELPGFIRLNICLYVSSLAATGYLLFNKPDHALAYAALSAFFGCAAAYAYNNTTDVKEDLINRKKINYFSDKKSGTAIIMLCALLGLYFALELPVYSTMTYASFTLLLTSYSFFRIKAHFLLKNVWTALGVSQSLLIGAFAAAENAGILGAYGIMFSLIFAGSVIADMRDVEGDRKTGVRTLPAELGTTRSRQLVYLLFVAAASAIVLLGTTALYVLLPFAPVSLFLLSRNRFADAHAMGGLSFIALLAWLLATGG